MSRRLALALLSAQAWGCQPIAAPEVEYVILYHSPVFTLYTARSLRKLGRLLEARGVCERVASESMVLAAPATWHKARENARVELTELAAEIPSVSLSVEGDSGSAHLTIDDRPVERERVIELDPGQHRAAASDGGRQTATTFTLASRSHQRLVLEFPPLIAPSSKVRAGSTPKRSAEAAPTTPYWPGWVVAGVGAVAVASGGVVGLLALDKRSSLRNQLPAGCQQARCLVSDRPEVEAHFAPAHRLALASDVLWISGAALVTTGVLLVVVDPRPKPAAAALSLSPTSASMRWVF